MYTNMLGLPCGAYEPLPLIGLNHFAALSATIFLR